MSNSHSQETKHKIIEAARKHFIQYGYDGARMQAIADEAKVNKALLHYYFKDKQLLYQEVFEYALIHIKTGFTIFNENSLTIQEKIQKFCKFCLNLYQNHSDIMIFLICEMQRSSEVIPHFVLQNLSIQDTDLAKQIQSGMNLGLIPKTNLQEVLLTILGLCLFPILANDFNIKFLGFPVGEYPLTLTAYYEKLPDKIMNFIKL